MGELYIVVPYVGTWIESSTEVETLAEAYGRSLRGNVDRNLQIEMCIAIAEGRSLRGNVDRNFRSIGAQVMPNGRRSLRGNVDRNGIGKVLSGKIICSNC